MTPPATPSAAPMDIRIFVPVDRAAISKTVDFPRKSISCRRGVDQVEQLRDRHGTFAQNTDPLQATKEPR